MKANSKLLLLTFAATVTVSAIGAGGVSAALLNDADIAGAMFTPEAIALDTGQVRVRTLTNENLMPGDVVTGWVDVENSGSNELRYSLSAVSAGVSGPHGGMLSAVLVVEVRTIDALTPLVKCDDFDGTVLQSAEALGVSNVMFGSLSPTDGRGDRILGAGASETLCVRVTLPVATGDAYQGATAVTTFTFDAEQTRGN
jgi:hypothetical protein